MKSIQKKKSPLTIKIIIVSVIIIIVAGSSVAGMYITHTGVFKDSNNTNTPTNEVDTKNTPSASTTPNPSKTPLSTQPTNDTQPNTLSASITYTREKDSSLQIGTVIDEVTSGGTCKLTLTKDGKNVTDSVGIQPLASSSTCKGFDIPIIELSKGVWEIKIDISAASKEAHLTGSVNVN